MIKGIKCPECGNETGDLIGACPSDMYNSPGSMMNVYKCNHCGQEWKQHYQKGE